MRQVYAVRGWQRVEITKWVKADSEQEAMNIVEDMNIRLEDYVNNTIGIDNDDAAELTEGGNYIEWESAEEDADHDYDIDTDKYRFEIWFDDDMIYTSDEEFESEDDAENAASDYINELIEAPDVNEGEYDFYDYEIKIITL